MENTMKIFLCGGILLASVSSAWSAHDGPWDMAALSKVPPATWGVAREQVQEVYSPAPRPVFEPA